MRAAAFTDDLDARFRSCHRGCHCRHLALASSCPRSKPNQTHARKAAISQRLRVAYAPWIVCLLARGTPTWSPPVVGCLLLSGLIHLAYSLCLQRGYQVADPSVVYPVARGTGPMLSSLGAFLLLNETPSHRGLLGLFAVIVGIGLISTRGDFGAFRRPGGRAGVGWGTATGSLIAAYTVLDWSSNLLRFLLLAPVVLRDRGRAREVMRGRWHLAVGVGLLSPFSYILVLAALGMGAPLSVVAPARETSMMVGALFGMVILREPVGAWRFVGCLVLTAGVVLLGAT